MGRRVLRKNIAVVEPTVTIYVTKEAGRRASPNIDYNPNLATAIYTALPTPLSPLQEDSSSDESTDSTMPQPIMIAPPNSPVNGHQQAE